MRLITDKHAVLERIRASFFYRRRIELVLFFLTFAISSYFSTIGVDPHHDGIMLKPALDVAAGQMLFRDTFSQYGALTTLLQAASLVVFGKYLITIKLLTAFFYGLISILLYLIFSKFIPKSLLFFTLILWILMAPYYVWTFIPWSSVYALFFQLLGAYFLSKSITGTSKVFILLSGVATSLTFWCRQPVGVFMFLAISGFFCFLYFLKQIGFKELKHNLILYFAGNFFICLLFVLWLLANHAIKDWWLQSIAFAFMFADQRTGTTAFTSIINSLFPKYLSFGPMISIWILIPLSTIFLSVVYSLKLISKPKDNQCSIMVLSLCFIGLASWLQYFPVACIRHVYWASTPMFCLFSFFIYKSTNRLIGIHTKLNKVIYNLIPIIFILFSMGPDLIYRFIYGLAIIQPSYYSVDQPQILQYMRLTKPQLVVSHFE
jgi:hypothetical protein